MGGLFSSSKIFENLMKHPVAAEETTVFSTFARLPHETFQNQ